MVLNGGVVSLIPAAVLASHAILDTMTDGGLGCALLWPFDLTRYFAPWRPIPVAPIGLDFFSPNGGFIALTELVLFSPLLLFALQSRRVEAKRVAAGVFLALWLVSVWLISSGDPIREAIVGFVLREDTAYTSGFSEAAFRTVTTGESGQEVRRLLGAPFEESWFDPPKDQPFQRAMTTSAASLPHECLSVRFETGVVVLWSHHVDEHPINVLVRHERLDQGAAQIDGGVLALFLRRHSERRGPPRESIDCPVSAESLLLYHPTSPD